MLFTFSLNLFLSCFFEPLKKGTNFKFQWNFTLKEKKIIFLLLISKLVDDVHCSPICICSVWYLTFRIYVFIAPTRSQKTTMYFGTFVTGVKPTSWCLLRPWYNQKVRNAKCKNVIVITVVPDIILIFVLILFYPLDHLEIPPRNAHDGKNRQTNKATDRRTLKLIDSTGQEAGWVRI